MLSLIQMLAVREVTSHGIRSLLTAAGVAIGAAVVVAVLALNGSVVGGFQDMVDALAGGADLQVRGANGGVPADGVDKITQLKGVVGAGAFVENWLLDPATGERILCVGVDFLSDEPATGLIESGALSEDAMAHLVEDPIAFLNSADSVILNADYAARLKLTRGDVRKYQTPTGVRELRVAGILPESAASRALGGALAIMSLDAAQILVGKPNKVDVINIRIEKDATADAVRTRVQRALGEQYTVEAPERRGKRLGRMLLTLTTVMRLISAVAILVGLFIVQNTLATAVHRRRREIAIQRALGITRALSGLMVLLEASLLGLLGGVLGAPLGLALAKGALSLFTESISSLYTAVHPRPPTLSSTLWFLVSAGAVVCSCLAALRPALHAASVPPALVLASRGTSTASEGRTRSGVRALLMSLAALLAAYGVAQLPSPGDEPWWGYVTCLLVLGAGALAAQPALFAVQALSIPVAGRFSFAWRLGAEALTRDAPRAGQTVTALMLGLALFIGVSGWVQTVKTSILNWMDAAVPADLSILEGTSMPDARAVPMEPSLAAGFADDPDVETVFRERFRTLDLGDETTRVQAIDASAYMSRARLPVVSSAGVVDGKALEAGEVLLTENLAARLGVKPGGTIALPGADGMRGMRVRAVVVDYTSEIGVVWMDWGVYARIFEDPKVDAFNLYLRPGADPDVVRSRILARHGASGTLRVVSHESLKAFVVDLIDDAFAATRALELIALLIALMGIINTLFAAVLDRVREIGVLRAVGATRAQVVSMVAVEAVLLGVTAAVMAAVIGSAFGYAFTVVIAEGTTGWRLPFVLPLTTVGEAFLLAILVAAVAAALPARWAARTNIIEAMRVE